MHVNTAPHVTPYVLLGRSRAERLTRRALAALAQWAGGWASLPDHAVACSDACETAPAALDLAWTRRALADGAEVLVALPWDSQPWMESLVFGLDDGAPRSPLAGSVADEALEALLAQLVEALTGQASAPAAAGAMAAAPALLRRGAGTVLCTVHLGARALRLLVPAAAAGAPARARDSGMPVVPLRQALARTPVALTVELGRAELTLGYLRTLAVGDVLALPMALDAPLSLHGPDGAPLCAAHLGSTGGQRAVELAANESRKET
jgi:hypothetical protein